MQTAKTMDEQDWYLLLALSFLWGGAYFFAGVAVKELPPLSVVLARVSLAALVLLPLFWFQAHSMPRNVSEWIPFAVMGLLNNVIPFGLIFFGQTYISVGLSAIINAMTPVFTVLVMAGFRQENLTIKRFVGVLLGVLGVAILHGNNGSFSDAQTLGILLCLGAAASYSFAALWGRKHLVGVAPVKSATCQLSCSTVFMCIVVAFVDQPWQLPVPSLMTMGSIVILAVFGTALAYIVFFKILVRAGASNAMLVTLLIPVTAMALGALFLGEVIMLQQVLGALVIGLGLMFIDGRLIDKIFSRNS